MTFDIMIHIDRMSDNCSVNITDSISISQLPYHDEENNFYFDHRKNFLYNNIAEQFIA